jgi:hypothetical protein
VQQWSTSVQRNLGADTTPEIAYHGERGFHLQEAVIDLAGRNNRARKSRETNRPIADGR